MGADRRFSWVEDPRLQRVLGVLDEAGEARLVGGCVRDTLLGQNPLTEEAIDIDIATDRTPDEMQALFSEAGLRWIATGEQHGTLTVVVDGLVMECTALRADEETDGRHATVRFTRDWEEDWRRRDFTINALYADRTGRLFDPAGGLVDLEAGRVRFIGDPGERIREDALRMLRFFRFSARFAEEFDREALEAIRENSELLDILSKERIWSELSRIFTAKRAPEALEGARLVGVLGRVLPGEPRTKVFARLHKLAEPREAVSVQALWPGQPRAVLRTGLKPSGHFLETYERVGKARHAVSEGSAAHALLYRFGRHAAIDGAYLAEAEGDPLPEGLLAELKSLPVPALPVSGKDIVARGIDPGPEVGAAMARFERIWLDAGAPADEPATQRLLDEALGR